MHGKGEFYEIEGNISNAPIDVANICNISRPAGSNGLIVVKLKRDFKYIIYIYIHIYINIF